MKVAFSTILMGALLAGFPTTQTTTQQDLPFTDNRWTLTGDRTAIATHDGRDVLQVETGFAHRKDISFENGTIDFDVQVTRRRSFVYVYFRVAGEGEREEFYLRPHKSGLPDALQYAPVWQGRSAWQLHHGPGATAAIGFEPGVWTHVRVVVEGGRAALFVRDMTVPALLVPTLAREPRAGSIALGGFLPSGVPGTGPIARFANVAIRPGRVPFDFDSASPTTSDVAADEQPAMHVVRAWEVSQSFVPQPSVLPTLPGADITGAFTRLETGPEGLLELHRHVRVPATRRPAAALARIRVRADEAGVRTFDLGFSDLATVFLNGRPVFHGDQSYSFDRPRRDGLIGFDQARLYLPLEAGDNDLAVLVSDSFGGWGLMGRFVGATGVTPRAGSSVDARGNPSWLPAGVSSTRASTILLAPMDNMR